VWFCHFVIFIGPICTLFDGPVVVQFPGTSGKPMGFRPRKAVATLLHLALGMMFPGNGERVQTPFTWAVVEGS
jgi:hypothetical protein